MNLLLFLGVSLVVIATPGPDTALTIRNALLGRRAGVLTAAGVASGQLAWALLTAFGVASVLAAHQNVLVVLRVVGGAYLVYLGLRALWSSWRTSSAPPPLPRAGGRRGYAQGLVSNLANPKMAVFFLSLLPQFAGPEATLPALAGLGLLFAMMTLLWLSVYVIVVDRARELLQRNVFRRWMDRITGIVLVGLGVRLASEPS
ncbi:MAG TPA: LysE family translocator [Lapillicoccus sp.]|nr:LysE family translocator [Lapillicoccus sp.]